MAQCGDPTATGAGGPGYTFADELPEAGEYQIGSLAMANSGPNTNGSQWFIITGETGVNLPPNYTCLVRSPRVLTTLFRYSMPPVTLNQMGFRLLSR